MSPMEAVSISVPTRLGVMSARVMKDSALTAMEETVLVSI